MGLLPEHLVRGLAVGIVSAALLCVCIILLWRRTKANLAWERGLARPLVLEGIRDAIQAYRTRTGTWPSAKADLRGRVRVDERSLKTVGNWDIRLVTAARDGGTARYRILVKDSWEEWQTDSAQNPDDLLGGKARGVTRPADSTEG